MCRVSAARPSNSTAYLYELRLSIMLQTVDFALRKTMVLATRCYKNVSWTSYSLRAMNPGTNPTQKIGSVRVLILFDLWERTSFRTL
jgi:hypothetical protein